MSAVKPSLVLLFDFDEKENQDGFVSEVKRTYSYIAPTQAVFHEMLEEPYATVLLRVIAHTPYWTNDEDSEGYWSNVMMPWLSHILVKLKRTVEAHNRVRAGSGLQALPYAELIIDFQGHASVRSSMTAEGFSVQDALAAVRGVRDGDVSSKVMP
ncbi:hypothetical protein [Slackia piriformis]|uniref:hypothetical protein n=1 Tax=Slackia piriformis TaxID=626934 RepID=UPI0032C08C74